MDDVTGIPPGTYEVKLPGPDGTPVYARVTIEDDGNGNRRMMIGMAEAR